MPLFVQGGTPAERKQPLSVNLDLLVKNDQPIARVDEPARGGIAIPSGVAFDPASLRVTTPDGTCIPAQIHPLGLGWPDGSLRRVLVQFRATVPALGSASYRLTQDSCAAPSPPTGATAYFLETGEAYVKTGSISFTVNPQDFRLPNRLWYGGRLVLDEGATLRMKAIRESMETVLTSDGAGGINDGRGRVNHNLKKFGLRDPSWTPQWSGRLFDYSSQLRGPATVTIEESGPMRAVLRIATPVLTEALTDGVGTVGLVARIYAYAGSSYIRVHLSLVNHERLDDRGYWQVAGTYVPGEPSIITNAKHLRELVYEVRPAYTSTADDPTLQYGTALGPSAPIHPSMPWNSRQLDATTQTPGYLAAVWPTAENDRIALASRYHWERFPKGVASDGHDTAELELWPLSGSDSDPVTSPLPAGRARGYEFVVDFATSATAQPLENLSALARAELHVLADPAGAWTTDTYFPFAPLNDGATPRYAEFQENVYLERERNPLLYGEVDFGDMPNPYFAPGRYNGYRGPGQSALSRYQASGDLRYYKTAQAMVEQALQNDVISWNPKTPTPPADPGAMYEAYPAPYRDIYNGREGDHQSLARYASSQYLFWNDLVLHYFLTGDRRVVDLLSLIPMWRGFKIPLGTSGGEDIYAPIALGPGREPAIALVNLLHAYQVVGCESILALRAGSSHVVPPFRAAYPAPLSCDPDGPADRMFRGLRSVFRYLKGQDQSPVISITPNSFDAATLDPMTWPTWSPTAPPAHLYDQTGFFANYPAEAFHYYYDMTADLSARDALLRVLGLQGAQLMPSGVVQYHRHNLGAPLERLMVGAHEVSAVAAFAYLDTGNITYLNQATPTLDWLVHYEQRGAIFAGMDADVSWLQHARRLAGLSEASLLTGTVSAETISLMKNEANQFDTTPERMRCFLVLEVARLKNENEGACSALDWLSSPPNRLNNLVTYCNDALPGFRTNLCAMRPSPTACPCP